MFVKIKNIYIRDSEIFEVSDITDYGIRSHKGSKYISERGTYTPPEITTRYKFIVKYKDIVKEFTYSTSEEAEKELKGLLLALNGEEYANEDKEI